MTRILASVAVCVLAFSSTASAQWGNCPGGNCPAPSYHSAPVYHQPAPSYHHAPVHNYTPAPCYTCPTPAPCYSCPTTSCYTPSCSTCTPAICTNCAKEGCKPDVKTEKGDATAGEAQKETKNTPINVTEYTGVIPYVPWEVTTVTEKICPRQVKVASLCCEVCICIPDKTITTCKKCEFRKGPAQIKVYACGHTVDVTAGGVQGMPKEFYVAQGITLEEAKKRFELKPVGGGGEITE